MAGAALLPVTARADGVEIAVRATPRSSRARIEGLVADAAGAAWLAVKVTAPPEAGKANAAVLALLAERLGVPASTCRVIAGATARRKRVFVAGRPDDLAPRVAALLAAAAAAPG